jgi:hypothetical protein
MTAKIIVVRRVNLLDRKPIRLTGGDLGKAAVNRFQKPHFAGVLLTLRRRKAR